MMRDGRRKHGHGRRSRSPSDAGLNRGLSLEPTIQTPLLHTCLHNHFKNSLVSDGPRQNAFRLVISNKYSGTEWA